LDLRAQATASSVAGVIGAEQIAEKRFGIL
jgi:hypothetical protein